MKNNVLFPLFLVICSVITAVICHNPFTYFNLAFSIVLLCVVVFSNNKVSASRIKYSAIWFLLFEIIALVLLLIGVNIYQASLVWLMYAAFVAIEIFVTPRIVK